MDEKVLVIGCKGRMGRRYMALLKHLGIEAIGIDQGDPWPAPEAYTRAIVATPTDQHWSDCDWLIDARKPFLCEKPVSKKIQLIQDIAYRCRETGVDGRMVCNWAFVLGGGRPLLPEVNSVGYDFFHTGKDGLAWDCIQLIYLSRKDLCVLANESPHFLAAINGQQVKLEDISRSYAIMLITWIVDPDRLWSMEDAIKATHRVLEYMEAK